ncbi:subtilisin-like serine protease PR1C [Metarhizium anisopliae]
MPGVKKVDYTHPALGGCFGKGCRVALGDNFAKDGAAWATRPAAAVVSRIIDSGVPCIIGLSNKKNSGLFNTLNPSSGQGVTSVNAFARAPGAIDGHVTDAPVAQSLTFSPNWDLKIKPTVRALGNNILGIKIGGGYKDITRTSFAGPLIAGILALITKVQGTFDPVLLNSLLITTAIP